MTNLYIHSNNIDFKDDLILQVQKHTKGVGIIEKIDNNCDLVFVDDDLEFSKKTSKDFNNLPIVFFTNFNNSFEGVDLIIKKPFILSEFLKLLEQGELLPKFRRNECLLFLEYSLYPNKKEIVSSKDNVCVKLTEKEVDILKYLYENNSIITTKEDLLKDVWGYNTEVTTHTIETHIYRLRQKVERGSGKQIIITQNGGYYLNM